MSQGRDRAREVVCLDTPILIWGVRRDSTRGQEDMEQRAQRYIQYLDQNDISVMLPTPVITEYLIGATETEFHEAQVLAQGFEIADFDLEAAMLAARLQRRGALANVAEEFQLNRQCLKTDAQIIAIAIVNNATKIVTNDVRHFSALAKDLINDGQIDIIELPDILLSQGNLSFSS